MHDAPIWPNYLENQNPKLENYGCEFKKKLHRQAFNVPVTRSWDKEVLKLKMARPFRWLCLSIVLNNTCWRSRMEFGVLKSQHALPHGFCVGVLKYSKTKGYTRLAAG